MITLQSECHYPQVEQVKFRGIGSSSEGLRQQVAEPGKLRCVPRQTVLTFPPTELLPQCVHGVCLYSNCLLDFRQQFSDLSINVFVSKREAKVQEDEGQLNVT